MQQRKLGADGPLVGAIALGCMSFGGSYGETDEAESHRTLARALELGVTHLDTSNIYGNGRAEEVIGSFLKGKEGNFRIATKAASRSARRAASTIRRNICANASRARCGASVSIMSTCSTFTAATRAYRSRMS